jgi:hypothetical protein
MSTRQTILIACFPFFFFSLSVQVLSQDEEEKYSVEGILWNNSGDTIHQKLLYINQFSFQFNITVIDSNDAPVMFYSPKDLAGFKFAIDSDYIEYISMNNPEDLGRLFLRVVYRGKYTLYQFLEQNFKSSMLTYRVSYYLWDDKWLYPPLTYEFEVESLLYHFSDCPELEYKIKSHAYGLSAIKQILKEYEACKLTDTYEFFYE